MITEPDMPTEYLTIVAASIPEAMAQFSACGLAREGYAIAGQIGPHRILRADGTAGTLAGEGMVAATFRRTMPRSAPITR